MKQESFGAFTEPKSIRTSRERHKSAPHKGSKIAQGHQSVKHVVPELFYSTQKTQTETPSADSWCAKRGIPFGIFQHPICCQKSNKLKGCLCGAPSGKRAVFMKY